MNSIYLKDTKFILKCKDENYKLKITNLDAVIPAKMKLQ